MAHRLEVLQRQLCGAGEPAHAHHPRADDRPPLLTKEQYLELYRWSCSDPSGFWAAQAAAFHWEQVRCVPRAPGRCSGLGPRHLSLPAGARARYEGPGPWYRQRAPASASVGPTFAMRTLQGFDRSHTTCRTDMREGPISISWFRGGRTNACYNCLDVWVHHRGQGDRTALIWWVMKRGSDDGPALA